MRTRESPRCADALETLVVVCLAVALSIVPLSAHASEAGKASAREHYQLASRLYEIREYDKALQAFKAAYLDEPDPAFLFNIAQCHRKLGQDGDALEFFRQYLKKAPPEGVNRPQASARIREIEETFEKGGGQPSSGAAAESSGPIVPPAAPASRGPTAATAPAVAPAPSPAPPSGAMAGPALIESPDADQAAGSRPTRRPLRIAGYACLGLGVASAVAALYEYTRARSLSDKVTNAAAPTMADDEAGRAAETRQWVFGGLGAAALGAGAVLLWLSSSPTGPPASSAAVAPLFGPGVAGVQARGVF